MNDLKLLQMCFQPWQWFVSEDEIDLSGIHEEGTLVWVYRKEDDEDTDETCYVVGYFMPDKTWFAESRHSTAESAAARVNYLNGGEG